MRYLYIFVDTVASTVESAKNVATSAVDMGIAAVGSAKGIRHLIFRICFTILL